MNTKTRNETLTLGRHTAKQSNILLGVLSMSDTQIKEIRSRKHETLIGHKRRTQPDTDGLSRGLLKNKKSSVALFVTLSRKQTQLNTADLNREHFL